MSGTVNKVILIGHTGDDVKMHYFEGGNSIGRFPLATNETYTDRNGQKVSNTEWHNITIRNKAAEICEKYLKKGDKVYVEGRLKTRKWQDDKGLERYSTEIQCSDFTFLTPKSDSNTMPQTNNGDTPNNRTSKNTQPSQNQPMDQEEDDLPF